jgi:hypothetical protein
MVAHGRSEVEVSLIRRAEDNNNSACWKALRRRTTDKRGRRSAHQARRAGCT